MFINVAAGGTYSYRKGLKCLPAENTAHFPEQYKNELLIINKL
jgi:hypothetical protein